MAVCSTDSRKWPANTSLEKNVPTASDTASTEKAKYVPEKIGSEIPACVGCGRCVDACLPDIANPVNVYNRLVDDLVVILR